jgi:anaerobic selenocysteine-containing dehydrogenase
MLKMTQLRVKGNVNKDEVVGIDYPVYSRFVGESTCLPIADAVISGKPYPIKAMIIHGSNPALIWPDSNKVKQALSQLDFLVVSDMFMSETAKLADVFLPSVSFWEADVFKDYQFVGLPMAVLANKVVEPLGECRDNWQIWAELGRRMGYAEYFPWQTNDELINDLLEPSGMTIEQLREHPSGVWYGNPGQKQKYLDEGLKSPSGKVELYSEILEGYGYPPLPEFIEPLTALAEAPEMAEDYPLILTTGARVSPFTHSRHRNVARLRKLAPYPAVEINTGTAREMGIATDDWVVVESPKGRLRIRAKVTDDIHPRVVSIPHGWEEANVNLLTNGDARDPISAYPGYKAAICRVTRD